MSESIAAHVEEPSHRLIALMSQEGLLAHSVLVGPAAEDMGPVSAGLCRRLTTPLLEPVQEARTDAPVSPVGMHIPAEPVLAEAIGRIGPVGPAVGDQCPVVLDQDQVTSG